MNSKRRRSGTRRAAKRRKQKRGIWRLIKIVLVMAALYCAVMYTPIFNVKNVVVEGTTIVKPEQALKTADIKIGTHMLKIDRKGITEKLEKIPYIADAKIKYAFPATVKIVIEEGEVYYSFKTDSGYINTDKNLKVLEITPEAKIFPAFENVSLKKNVAGEKISIDESEKFDIILVYYDILKGKDILSQFETITISGNNIFMKMKSGVRVKCGGQANGEHKIAALMECIKKEPVTIGTFDVTDPKRIVYSIE